MWNLHVFVEMMGVYFRYPEHHAGESRQVELKQELHSFRLKQQGENHKVYGKVSNSPSTAQFHLWVETKRLTMRLRLPCIASTTANA